MKDASSEFSDIIHPESKRWLEDVIQIVNNVLLFISREKIGTITIFDNLAIAEKLKHYF